MRLLFLLILLSCPAFSATINVPMDQPTIQLGIDNAVNGDTVLVAPGTYKENIIFWGKAITLTSSHGAGVTIIDGNHAGSGVTFKTGEGQDSILDGFTITNGSGQSCPNFKHGGGGVCCYYKTSPVIRNNIISGNHVSANSAVGGGVYCDGGNARIESNIIIENSVEGGSTGSGGGVYCNAGSQIIENNIISWNFAETSSTGGRGGGIGCMNSGIPKIRNNYIEGNTSDYLGGGIQCLMYTTPIIKNNVIINNNAQRGGGIHTYQTGSSKIQIKHNTITKNYAQAAGGGIYLWKSKINVIDCILWNNDSPLGKEIGISAASSGPTVVDINYCDVEGGQAMVWIKSGGTLNWGAGMIDADPLFAKGPHSGFYLSQTAAGQPVNSPCLDVGSDQAINLGMDTLWTRTDAVCDDGVVDMGYHHDAYKHPSLQTDFFRVSEATGGNTYFFIIAGPENANRNYALFGNVSGVLQGTPLPGGMATLPLKWDAVTTIFLNLANTPIFKDFFGTLDAGGVGEAQLKLPPIPGHAGVKLYFAYALNGPWNFVSNPVMIEIVR